MKCLCNHCSITLEFEEEGVGQSIECPECNQETVLYELKEPEKDEAKEGAPPESAPQKTPQSTTKSTERLLNAVSIDLGGLVAVAIVFGILAGLLVAGGASRGGGVFTGIAGLVIACIAIVLSVVWAVLPFVLYYQLDHQVRLLQFIAKRLVKSDDYRIQSNTFKNDK